MHFVYCKHISAHNERDMKNAVNVSPIYAAERHFKRHTMTERGESGIFIPPSRKRENRRLISVLLLKVCQCRGIYKVLLYYNIYYI